MDNSTLEYRFFIDNLVDTTTVYEWCPKHLENYKFWAEIEKNEGEKKLSGIYEILGPLFNSLNNNQRKALVDWSEDLYKKGIINCLEQIQYNDYITLAYKKSEDELEIIEGTDLGDDFKKRYKVFGQTSWED
jgi:hypothetical protein